MAQEIEIKIFEIDREKVEQQLIDIWAEKVYEDNLETQYFDTWNNTKQYLRIRKKSTGQKITYKNLIQKNGLQMNEEYETDIHNAEEMKSILESLWYNHYKTQHKKRICYTYQNIVFDFDKYDHIPWFLEIEWPDEQTIHTWIKKLWLVNNLQWPQMYDDFWHDYDAFIASMKHTS